jgi:hypothetical protein
MIGRLGAACDQLPVADPAARARTASRPGLSGENTSAIHVMRSPAMLLLSIGCPTRSRPASPSATIWPPSIRVRAGQTDELHVPDIGVHEARQAALMADSRRRSPPATHRAFRRRTSSRTQRRGSPRLADPNDNAQHEIRNLQYDMGPSPS